MEVLAYSAMVLGLVLLLAKIGEDVFNRLRLPGFLGAIIVGILLSPGGLNIVQIDSRNYLALFTALGINFLLFLAGAEEFRELELLGRRVIGMIARSAAIFAVPSIGVALFTYKVMGLGLLESSIIGVIMGAVSAGPMVKTLIDTGLISTKTGRDAFLLGILVEVSAVVVFNTISETGVSPFLSFAYIALLLTLFYVFGKYVFYRLLMFVEEYVSAREAPFAVIIGIILLAGYIAELTGFNAALIALALGLFAEPYLRERPDITDRIKAFTYGFFEPLFFAGLGIYVNTLDSWVLGYAAMFGSLTILLKMLVSRGVCKDMLVGIMMLSKGGVDGALLLSAYNTGIVSPLNYDAVLIAALASTMVFAVAMRPYMPSTPLAGHTGVSVDEIASSRIAVPRSALVRDTLDVFSVLDRPAAVVVDEEERPVGIVRAVDLVFENPQDFMSVRVEEVMRRYVPKVRVGERLTPELLDDLSKFLVLAVVDRNDRLVHTVYIDDIVSFTAKRLLGSKILEKAG